MVSYPSSVCAVRCSCLEITSTDAADYKCEWCISIARVCGPLFMSRDHEHGRGQITSVNGVISIVRVCGPLFVSRDHKHGRGQIASVNGVISIVRVCGPLFMSRDHEHGRGRLQ
ncbi:hypothetical protein EVAR_8690_1 [Eumeta japonica]|uniref:Uncharacterized protein n=1 Tax=Eumeta variegata TaxID=151549 RepID=A0A4C1TUK6_EUMVA|nr:hypothetical protein EVAR_8690_1 [Eumeta japonica]